MVRSFLLFGKKLTCFFQKLGNLSLSLSGAEKKYRLCLQCSLSVGAVAEPNPAADANPCGGVAA
jgi:hypothetical protein